MQSVEKCFEARGVPVIASDKYTFEPDEKPNIKVYSNQKLKTKWIYPDTSERSELETEQFGKYTLLAENESGFISQGEFFCRYRSGKTNYNSMENTKHLCNDKSFDG